MFERLKQIKTKALRDAVTFLLGAGGLVFETVTSGAEKPTLIIAFVGMMGLPLFLHKDENDAAAHVPPIPPATPQVATAPDLASPVAH